MWYINDFHADISLDPTGDVMIVETVTVDFAVDKHGIFRNIPDKGIDIEFEGVLQDDRPAEYDVYRNERNDLTVRIGDPDITLTGQHTYKITYLVEGAWLYEDEMDVFAWNVTGNDWDVPIAAASAHIEVPTEVSDVKCYEGEYGSAQECPVLENGKSLDVKANGPFTVLVGFDKGYFVEPTVTDRLVDFLRDHLFALLLLPLAAVPPIMWWIRGRDAKLRTIIAHYEPPTGMTAAQCGMIVREKLDKHVFAAMIAELGTQGFLTIVIEEKPGWFGKQKVLRLKRMKDIDESVDLAHRLLFVSIFQKANAEGVVALSSKQGLVSKTTRQEIAKEIGEQLERAGYYHGDSFAAKRAMLGTGVVLLLGGLMAVLLAPAWWPFIFALVPTGISCLIFGSYMTRKTEQGNAVAEQVLGFKLFTHTAERYRSAWQENEGIFTEFLPYAIAFRDTHRWASAFQYYETQQPTWLVSPHPMSAAWIAADLSSFETAFSSAAAPSSRGGGSGSFSGGGFGGGGGGSW